MKVETKNATTGISEIDYLCGGGIPRSSIVLVEEVGIEKSNYPSYYVAIRFLDEGLSKGERGIIVLTEHAVDEYLGYGPYVGVDLVSRRNSGLLTIIDAFSGYAGLSAQSLANQADIVIDNPTNTVKLLDEMRKLLLTSCEEGYKGRIRVVVDSLSVLMAAAGFQKCWNFLIALGPIHRISECNTMALFFPAMHASNEVEACERLLDGVIEFSGTETNELEPKKFVQIKKMRRSPFRAERILYTKEEWNVDFNLKKRLIQ